MAKVERWVTTGFPGPYQVDVEPSTPIVNTSRPQSISPQSCPRPEPGDTDGLVKPPPPEFI